MAASSYHVAIQYAFLLDGLPQITAQFLIIWRAPRLTSSGLGVLRRVVSVSVGRRRRSCHGGDGGENGGMVGVVVVVDVKMQEALLSLERNGWAIWQILPGGMTAGLSFAGCPRIPHQKALRGAGVGPLFSRRVPPPKNSLLTPVTETLLATPACSLCPPQRVFVSMQILSNCRSSCLSLVFLFNFQPLQPTTTTAIVIVTPLLTPLTIHHVFEERQYVSISPNSCFTLRDSWLI